MKSYFFNFSEDYENSSIYNDFTETQNRGLIPTGDIFYDELVENYSQKIYTNISSYGEENP